MTSVLRQTNELFSEENTFAFALLGALSSLRAMERLLAERREADGAQELDATSHLIIDALLGLLAVRAQLEGSLASLPPPAADAAPRGRRPDVVLSELFR